MNSANNTNKSSKKSYEYYEGRIKMEKELEEYINNSNKYEEDYGYEHSKNSKLYEYNEDDISAIDKNSEEELYKMALKIMAKENRVSISFLQRKLSIWYNKSAKLIEQMKDTGVTSINENYTDSLVYKINFDEIGRKLKK